MSENIPVKIDLNPMSLAVLHGNPTVILDSELKKFIRLHSIERMMVFPSTDPNYSPEHIVLYFYSGDQIILTTSESVEFMLKVSFIAAQVQEHLEALQQNQAGMTAGITATALQEAARKLKLKR